MTTINTCSADSKDVIVITIEACDKSKRSEGVEGGGTSSSYSNYGGKSNANDRCCGKNSDNICPKGGTCVKCTKRKRGTKQSKDRGVEEGVGDFPVKIQKLELPVLNPRLHGPGCAMEVCVIERHMKNCPYKKLDNNLRHPVDDRSGSYECVGRMGFRTCNPEEGVVVDQNPTSKHYQDKEWNTKLTPDPVNHSFNQERQHEENYDDLFQAIDHQSTPKNSPRGSYDHKASSPQGSFKERQMSFPRGSTTREENEYRNHERKSNILSPHGSFKEDDYNRDKSQSRQRSLLADLEHQSSPRGSLKADNYDRKASSAQRSFDEYRPASSPRGSLDGDQRRQSSIKETTRRDSDNDQESLKGDQQRPPSSIRDSPNRNESEGPGTKRGPIDYDGYNTADSQMYETANEDTTTGRESSHEQTRRHSNQSDDDNHSKKPTVMTLLTQPIFYETFRPKTKFNERRTYQHDLLTLPTNLLNRNAHQQDMLRNLLQSPKTFNNVNKIVKYKYDKGNQVPTCSTKGSDVPSVAVLNKNNGKFGIMPHLIDSDETIITLRSNVNNCEEVGEKSKFFGLFKKKIKPMVAAATVDNSVTNKAAEQTMKRTKK